MFKRKQLPTTECQYKTNCYRKNPSHFEQFGHSHIHKIVSRGREKGSYLIPDELSFSRDIVKIQCEIVEKIFPHLVSDQPAKKVAVDRKDDDNVQKTKECDVSKDNLVVTPEKSIEIVDSPSKLNPEATEFNPSPSTSTSTSDSSNTTTTASKDAERETKRKIVRNIHEYFDVVAPKGQMAKKLANAAPYNFFLTTITASKATHSEPLSVTFIELLDESLGELENSVQINFMVDISWLMANYYFAGQE